MTSRRDRIIGVIGTIAFMVSACLPGNAATDNAAGAVDSQARVELPAGVTSGSVPAAGTCHLGNHDGQPLPDRGCTPGAINPDVRQDNITSTVCKSGWTKTVRPPVSVTSKLKKQIDQAYGLPTSTQGELDHLISLELGGAPSDPRNLWVEVGPIPNPKDKVENQLNSAVCGGLITLDTAQQAIAVDWTTAIDSTGLVVKAGRVCLQGKPSRCASGRHGTGE